MRTFTYSRDGDALLVELADQPIDHAEEAGQIIIHLSSEGTPVLLEILDASEFLLDALRSLVKTGKENLL